MFKLVDAFNGWESKIRHASYRSACRERDRAREVFRARPENKDSVESYMVLPHRAEWKWDYTKDKWVWQIPAKSVEGLSTQDEIMDFEEGLGLSDPGETYTETAYRLEREGDNWNSELYRELEKRWFDAD